MTLAWQLGDELKSTYGKCAVVTLKDNYNRAAMLLGDNANTQLIKLGYFDGSRLAAVYEKHC